MFNRGPVFKGHDRECGVTLYWHRAAVFLHKANKQTRIKTAETHIVQRRCKCVSKNRVNKFRIFFQKSEDRPECLCGGIMSHDRLLFNVAQQTLNKIAFWVTYVRSSIMFILVSYSPGLAG